MAKNDRNSGGASPTIFRRGEFLSVVGNDGTPYIGIVSGGESALYIPVSCRQYLSTDRISAGSIPYDAKKIAASEMTTLSRLLLTFALSAVKRRPKRRRLTSDK